MDADTHVRARQLALAAHSQMVLRPEDEEVLWWLLQRHAAPPTLSGGSGVAADAAGGGGVGYVGEPCLNYDEFTQVAAECREAIGPSADLYLQPSTFLRLGRDAHGCVPAAALFRCCTQRSAQMQLRIDLGLLDAAGTGALTPEQLRQWLDARAPRAACAEVLLADADWLAAVVARLQLLHARRGRLLVKDLAASPAILELAMSLRAWEATDAAAATAEGAPVPTAALLAPQHAWCSPAVVAALRLRFHELDVDGDGLLSQQEFSSFSQGTMTPLFIARLFAHHCSSGSGGGLQGGGGRMDFPAFAAFCTAWEQRGSTAGVRYFFPLLDLRGCGYLTQAELYTFFREVHALWLALGQYTELRVEDVLAEVSDLLQAPDPQRIAPADLQRSGVAGTIIGLLADVGLFWEHENREALLQQAQAQAEGEAPL